MESCDLKKRQDKDFVLRLIEWTDIVLVNFRFKDVMEKLGLGYHVCQL